MTAEKLYGILELVDALDKRLDLQPKLEAVGSTLSNLVSQPAQPQYQSTLASALGAFEDAAKRLAESMTPPQFAAIQALEGAIETVKVSKKTTTHKTSVSKKEGEKGTDGGAAGQE